MCGIAGIMMADPGARPDRTALDAMQATLAHRGPDGTGHYESGPFAMVHNRLAIIDLETGDQPLSEPGGTALIANGEIYNYVELRQAMDDVAFATQSDCEPPLYLYRRRGTRFADELRGMYAIALHDPAKGRLVLVRDPFGIKPLYYCQRGQSFAFASEPEALLAAGLVSRRIDAGARNELLQLQFTTGARTIFDGIERVLPGETLVVEGGSIVERHRHPALPDNGPADWDEDDALDRLNEALSDSVLVHQRSDVPYGMFLSGGIDSSALLCQMARLNTTPVLAFTAGFSGTSVADERALARQVAIKLGARHEEVEFSRDDFFTLLPSIAAALDDPTADYATLPTWKLAQLAAREVKVVLSGEGGDELFAGYGRYRSAVRPWWRGGRPSRRRGILDGLGVLRERPDGWRDGIVRASKEADENGRTALQIEQAADCADWLPNDLLIKLDRCLMAHGVEGRTPMLDPAVAAVAFRLPDRLKLRGRLGKYLLRQWLARELPEARPFARKRGFTVPVGEWIGAEAKRLGPLVAAAPGIQEIARPGTVASLFADGGKRTHMAAWTLLFYALWHRRHALGLPPNGDVFETLSAT